MLTIKFWGVRGSIAAAGPATATVGGNTSCVEVRAGKCLLVLDAGTGLRALGTDLVRRGASEPHVHLLLSHFHWDHIQGFPFFGPAYVPGTRIDVYGLDPGGRRPRYVRGALEAQMRRPFFPVGLDAMRAELSFHALGAGDAIQLPETRVRTAAARHPNGCLAYRVEHGGRSVVFATDTEPEAAAPDRNLIELARGADVLIYDAQYTPEELGARRGWGHSTAEEGTRIAAAAGVGRLVLFHHDPAHDDLMVAAIEKRARALFPPTEAAREGHEIHVAGERVRMAA